MAQKNPFTTSDGILAIKEILGSTIVVSTRNGFPTAPKQLQAADNYLFSKQTAGDSEYVNAVLPHHDEDEDDNSPNGFFFFGPTRPKSYKLLFNGKS